MAMPINSFHIKPSDLIPEIESDLKDMNYEKIANECEGLNYRDKLRLAQLLIQLARKEEEKEHPAQRGNLDEKVKNIKINDAPTDNIDSIQYVIDRISKLRPSKKKTLSNCIKTMYQFQGGISEKDQEQIIKKLEKKKFLKIESNNRVSYLDMNN